MVDSESASANGYSVTARYYDDVYTEQTAPADLPLYLHYAEQAPGSILELGCGTGRVTLPLARAGYQVTALDLAHDMLAILKRKLAQESAEVQARITVIQGNMADFELAERFGLVISPFRAFQHLLESEQQRRCLELIARHLLPGGRFVFNAFQPNLRYIVKAQELAGTFKQVNEATLSDEHRILRRYVQLTPHPGRQRHQILWKYEICDRFGKVVETHLEEMWLRWFYRWEAEYLLELSGLEIMEAYGGFDKRPLDENAADLIFVCRRKES